MGALVDKTDQTKGRKCKKNQIAGAFLSRKATACSEGTTKAKDPTGVSAMHHHSQT